VSANKRLETDLRTRLLRSLASSAQPSAFRRPVPKMLRIWFIFCLGSFAVSILTLTYVQICVWKKHGWSALRKRPLATTYWGNLSPMERALLWLGFVAFFITLVSATGWKFINLFGQRVTEAINQSSNPPLEPTARFRDR
jgi:hypothetical protein